MPLTHDEARRAVDGLDEIQLVVESILSEEWGNCGNPRHYRGVSAKPAQCVPRGSVYGIAEALQEQREQFVQDYELKTFEDAWWYVVPPEPQSGAIDA